MGQERLAAKEEVARQAEAERLEKERSHAEQAAESDRLERERLAAKETAKCANEVAVPTAGE